MTIDSIPAQTNRRILITGANSGIGYETAQILAAKGAEIILPARSLDKANDAATRIRRDHPSATIVPAILDLASLASVREFAAWYAAKYPGQSLDVLINNAGVMGIPKRELTPDGFERQFATNFLGPFALTALLYPHLRQQPGTRVVIVSSGIANQGKIDFDNLQGQRRYSPMTQAYAQSKLADSLFAIELERRVSAAGSPIMVNAAHPGYAITNLQSSGPTSGGGGFSIFMVMAAILKPIASHDAFHGALPTLYAATSPKAVHGGYYGPDGLLELKGSPTAVKHPPQAKDPAVAARLWAEAEKLTQTPFNI
jgi:NAD(P)-dependent dehydrogenase (short-subunit alcohol dehydrogenase family)